MNILNNARNHQSLVKGCYDDLKALNRIFTNSIVYKIMRIVDEKKLYEIKDKAREFQLKICCMLDGLNDLYDNGIVLEEKMMQDIFYNQEEPDFPTEIDERWLKILSKSQKKFNKLYTEIQDQLKSYESFIVKKAKVADRIYKRDKKQEYQKEIAASKNNQKNKFDNLDNDKTLSLYLKMYNKSMEKLQVVNKKIEVPPLSEQENKYQIDMNFKYIRLLSLLVNMRLQYLKKIDKSSVERFDVESNNFKTEVIDLFKNINKFDEKLNSIQQLHTR